MILPVAENVHCHRPDAITYITEGRLLLPNDAFGQHLASVCGRSPNWARPLAPTAGVTAYRIGGDPGAGEAPADCVQDAADGCPVEVIHCGGNIIAEEGTMRPTETLMHEHQIILMVLDAAEREARWIEETGEVRVERVEQMVDFFRNFADRCHHAKEENLLFVRMEERGMPRQGSPIEVMLHEHDLGRGHVRAVAEALPRAADDPTARQAVLDNLTHYVQLLRDHIYKEDYILYPMADQMLSPDDRRTLEEAFERVEREEIGPGVHERYHRLAHELQTPPEVVNAHLGDYHR